MDMIPVPNMDEIPISFPTIWDLNSHFRELEKVYRQCKKIKLKKSKQALGPSLQWPRAGPAAAGASKDVAKTFHTQ
jgi:hypothetical protein